MRQEFKVVGYIDLDTLKVYKTKKEMMKSKFKCKFASMLMHMAKSAKIKIAKTAIKLHGYTWERYIVLCRAILEFKRFNISLPKSIRLSLSTK